VSFQQYSTHVAEVYRNEFLSITDPEERAAAFQPMWDFVNSGELVNDSNDVAVKSVVSVMNSAKEQFANLVCDFF
jgi:hypothetical protein